MNDNDELTYYEYWLTQDVWEAKTAIQLIADYIKFKRPWNQYEDYWGIVRSLQIRIKQQLLDEKAWHVFTKRVVALKDNDETDEWLAGDLNLDLSAVKPKEFIEWLYGKGYPIPYEFKVFIGIEEKEERLTRRDAERIDKAVCKGIAKTLWDIYPDMENEEMQYHRAIQFHGPGKGYPTDTTIRRWLSEVDSRTAKRGRKKKI